MSELFEKAKEKVMSNPVLEKFADFILADWNEGDEHWQWVIDSDDEEIADWVEGCQS